MPKTTALIILDGWGQGQDYPGNAIKLANTPNWDKLVKERPMSQLTASGEMVGLPDGQMGNSEVGHTILGAGRIIYQTLLRINKAISDNTLAENSQLNDFFSKYKSNKDPQGDKPSYLHLMGLLSDGGVHSHQDHLVAILEQAIDQGIDKIMLHLFTDGRDTAPKSAVSYMQTLESQIAKITEGGQGQAADIKIATVSGRYYAMDRDKRWERTGKVYNLLTGAVNEDVPVVTDLCQQLEDNYAQEIFDEFIPPFISADAAQIAKERGGFICENDYVISINFRADRMRQLTAALAAQNFDGFTRPFALPQSSLLTMTDYDPNLPLPHIFGKDAIANSFGELVAKQGMTQLRLAETEKFAHVTYFFSGGREAEFEGEKRCLIPSLKVATYDLAPQMCAPEITDELVAAITSGEYDFILCNYANGDMVGHSGKLDAAIQTAEVIDANLARVLAAIDESSAQALITADHGNCEEMLTADNKPHTAHTLNPVPLIYYGPLNIGFADEAGGLADIAPTLAKLMGLEVPQEMSGRILIEDK